MNTLADRIKEERTKKKLSQEALGRLVGVGKSSVSQWETGTTKKMDGNNIVAVARALGVDPYWLSTGKGNKYGAIDGEVVRRELSQAKPESNAEYLGGFDVWDSDTPLGDDEVALPFFREVKLSAGNGSIEVQENHGCKLRFAKSTLKKAGVQAEHASCVSVKGTSMEPVLLNGSTVGIDKSDTTIVDGKMYAIAQRGELRVKLVYKLPGGGLRLKSYNNEEYPDEPYPGEAALGVEILGRVFWWSVLL